jgi:hypothetical protein
MASITAAATLALIIDPWPPSRLRQQIRFGRRGLLAFLGNLRGRWSHSASRRPGPIDRKPATHLDEARRREAATIDAFYFGGRQSTR